MKFMSVEYHTLSSNVITYLLTFSNTIMSYNIIKEQLLSSSGVAWGSNGTWNFPWLLYGRCNMWHRRMLKARLLPCNNSVFFNVHWSLFTTADVTFYHTWSSFYLPCSYSIYHAWSCYFSCMKLLLIMSEVTFCHAYSSCQLCWK